MACGSGNESETCMTCENTLVSFIFTTEDDEKLCSFLYVHGVIPRSKVCSICNNYMILSKKNYKFRCDKRYLKTKRNKKTIKVKCRSYVSQHKNTWFEYSKLSRKILCRFVAFWCLTRPPRFDILKFELDLSHHAICAWIENVREVCVVTAILDSQVLGGPGKVVEIDEGKIGKLKYKRGLILKGDWAFSGFEQDTKKSFIVPVTNRGQAALLSVIKKYILPGTTVVSECWKTYNCLELNSYLHLSDNLSYNFIDPDTDYSSQDVEELWQEVRGNVSRYGERNCHYIGHLAEFIFKRKHPDLETRLHYIFKAIGHVYNGKDPEEIAVEAESSDESQNGEKPDKVAVTVDSSDESNNSNY